MLDITISNYLTLEAIQKTFETLPPLNTAVMDRFYPEAKRRTHPFPYVSVSDIQTPVKNIAVTKRGGNPTPIYGSNNSITMIEVQPFRPSERINAVEINNLKLMNSSAAIENYVNQKVDRLRQSVRLSTEALAAQSLTGTISYPLVTEGGIAGTYDIAYGGVLSQTISKLWTASDITIDSILGDFINMTKAINSASQYGGKGITFWAGTKVFKALAKIVTSITSTAQFSAGISTVNGNTINFFGFNVELMADTYISDIKANTATPVVAETKIMAVANDAPFELVYAALDNIEANLAAMPIFIQEVPDARTNSIEMIAESKPLPIPYTKAICWATVAS